MDRTRLVLVPLLVTGLVLGAAACTGGSDDATSAASSGGSAAPSTDDASPTSSGASGTAQGSTLPVDAPARAAAPAQQPGTLLEVLALQRQDATLLLTLAVRNESGEEINIGNSLGTPTDYDLRSVALVDPVGLKRYLPYLDDDDRCLCSKTDFTPIGPGERAVVTALYPAPPESARTLTVQTPIGAVADAPVS